MTLGGYSRRVDLWFLYFLPIRNLTSLLFFSCYFFFFSFLFVPSPSLSLSCPSQLYYFLPIPKEPPIWCELKALLRWSWLSCLYTSARPAIVPPVPRHSQPNRTNG